MRYAPPGLCLNDFAVLSDPAGGYAVLHLQGPWTERFDHLRMETSFGRATSTDLVDWRPQGAAFGTGLPGRFDQQAVWTMHPFHHDPGMAMLYTGISGLTTAGWPLQSIGLAYSDRTDGTRWRRSGVAPVVEADPRWYRTDDGMGWRDPFVVRDDDAGWAMVICASDASLPLERSGCVGLATSADLEHWTVHPPLISPGDIDQIECPVLERLPDGWLLLGCHNADNRFEGWTAPKLAGPWLRLGPLGPVGAYAPRLITAPDGALVALHTTPRKVGLVDSGALCRGMLAQPKVLALQPDGAPPRLEWWTGLDTWLGEHTDRVTQHAVGDLVVTGPTEIVLRAEGMLRIGCDGRKLWATGPDGTRLRETVLTAPAETLRILTIGEYVEVYADNVFALSVACYTGCAGPWTVSSGGPTSTLPVRPIRLPDPTRDDVSAVWPGH